MTQKSPINLIEEQKSVRNSIRSICANFDNEYWREKDENSEYPTEFVETLAG